MANNSPKFQKGKTQIAGQAVQRDNVEKTTHSFDALKMYFGEPFEVGNGITITQPTVGDILEIGEMDFYEMLYRFIGNPTMFRLQLWDAGVDWNKITSYDLFRSYVKFIPKETSQLLFGDIDFSGFDVYGKTITRPNEDGDDEEVKVPTLYNVNTDIEIDEECFSLIADYLRTMFNIFPKIEKAKGKATKEAIIEEDRMNLAYRQSKGEDGAKSGLLAMVSSCINHPGFKYNLRELKDVGICQFMDSVQRLQVYESSTALLKGMYSGFVDGSKISVDSYNWMKDLSKA